MLAKNNKISIIDTTLRDGLQSPGVFIAAPDAIRLAALLAEAGVDEIEAGIPARGGAEIEMVREMVRVCPSTVITPWCRPKLSDLKAALACATGSVHFSFPLSDLYLDVVGISLASVFNRCSRILRIAAANFPLVSVGIQDATRTPIGRIIDFTEIALKHGARRVRLADTVGIADPLYVKDLMTRLVFEYPETDFEFHAHNDLGMATANAVTAARCGAKSLSVSINGLGERAGNAPLEEVVMALRFAPDITCGVKAESLFPLCKRAAKLSRRPIAPNKPITGEMIFTHQSGIHCFGLAKDKRTFEPFFPATAGRSGSVILFGPQSGRSTLDLMLDSLGISMNSGRKDELYSFIVKESGRLNKMLTVGDIASINARLSGAGTIKEAVF
jgi:homocitrate synthase NifV